MSEVAVDGKVSALIRKLPNGNTVVEVLHEKVGHIYRVFIDDRTPHTVGILLMDCANDTILDENTLDVT